MFLSNIRLDRTEGQKRPKIREEQSQEDKKNCLNLSVMSVSAEMGSQGGGIYCGGVVVVV